MSELVLSRVQDYRFIIIGRGAEGLLRILAAERVGVFESMKSFDRWRSEAADRDRSIGADVDVALDELGRSLHDLNGEVRDAIHALRTRTVVPFVRDFVPPHVPERTFYRRWNCAVGDETPKRFLTRVRLNHVRRLVERRGLSEKEAAWRAGFASVWHLRRFTMNSSEPEHVLFGLVPQLRAVP